MTTAVVPVMQAGDGGTMQAIVTSLFFRHALSRLTLTP